MTVEERAEAIRFFETMLEMECNIIGAKFRYSKLALEALKQEPCEDMVSRDAMWDVLQRLYGTEGELVEELMSLPPVLPMPKMGKWIMSDDGLYRPICNRCAAHPWKGYIPSVEEATNVFKFCPNCGAKMQEVEE